MAENYEVGGKYYLPVTVKEGIGTDYKYPVVLEFVDCKGRDTADTVCIADEPDLLLTAEEIYASRQVADKIEHMGEMLDYGRKKYDEIEELKARIAELEKENGELKADCNEWKDAVDEKITDVQHLAEESTELKAEYDVLKSRNAELEALLKEVMATRDEAIKQNNELIADCKDWKKAADETLAEYKELKAERDSARKQADIFQEEIKKLTAERDKFAKTAKDKADLAREAIDHLQEENNKLKREVENRTTDYKLMRDNNAVYLSRIAIRNEVIDALVEKIRRLQGED